MKKFTSLAAIAAASIIFSATPATAQPRNDAPPPADTETTTPPPPEDTETTTPDEGNKSDGEVKWSFATGQSPLFPVKTWPELVKLVQFVDRYYYVTMQSEYVEQQAKPSIRTMVVTDGPGGNDASDAREAQYARFANFFTALGFILHGTGDTVPAETQKAVLNYMAEEGCSKTADKTVGEGDQQKTIKVWTPACYPLFKKVEEVYTDRRAHAPASAGDSLAIADKIMATAKEYAEYNGQALPDSAGDAVILAHGAIAGLTSILPEGERPWKLNDGDKSGGGTYSNKGFAMRAGAGLTHVFARNGQTDGNVVSGHAGMSYTLSFPLSFDAEVGLMRRQSGGVADHYTEEAGSRTVVYGAAGVAFVPRLSDTFGLKFRPKALLMSNGGKGAAFDAGATIYMGSQRQFQLDVLGQVGYIDWGEPTGDSPTAPRVVDDNFTGTTVGGLATFGYNFQ